MTDEYHFTTRWRVPGAIEEVYELISHPLDYPRWWPAVYLETEEAESGDEKGIGRHIRLYTKGWLPYTLRWESITTEVERPRRLAIRAIGDFNGRGIWMLEPDGEFVNVVFDWKLAAEKPLIRYLSFLLKPAFSANHRWAMARGEESMRLELARRHTSTPEQRAKIPAPRGPNKTSGLWLALGAAVILAALIAFLRLAFR